MKGAAGVSWCEGERSIASGVLVHEVFNGGVEMCHRQLKGVRIDFGEVSQGSCVEMSGVFLASSFIITHF